MKKWVCVFCASTEGGSWEYMDQARVMGRGIAGRGLGLVYGGATVGTMGAVADATLQAGGEVVGVIPEVLMERELGHARLTELHVVRTMHERKALMAERADAFVALPGGFGTLDEFIEILTWAQLRIHTKPCVLVNVLGYYDGLLEFLQTGVERGFLKRENFELIRVARDADEALDLVERAWAEDGRGVEDLRMGRLVE
ncbi:MAG: TIGR00730 family Rossman fold protein [Acidobacteriaceae bacterium]